MHEINISVTRKSVASIDGNRCVNCGKCEEYCPVDAIKEHQKTVCHLCPECTEMAALTVQQMEDMRNESCTLACPLGISPQGYINLIRAGKVKEAYDLIWAKNPLPAVCGYVCTHPCEQACKRGTLVDSPMNIRGLKRYLGESFLDEAPAAYPVNYKEEIAIVGAGPAGLTAAHTLASKGYRVTVFDQAAEAGGMLLSALPDFRIDKDAVRKEIKRLEKAGIEFVLGGKVDPKTLKKDFDKVIVATGVAVSRNLTTVQNWRSKNVMLALNFMQRVNTGYEMKLHGNVVVIGGGCVAIDCARAATRLGAEKVTMMCLETGDAIPAPAWDLKDAADEGIKLIEGVSPLRYEEFMDALPHKLVGVTYTKIENLNPETFEFDRVGDEITMDADFVIVATGSYVEAQYLEGGDALAGDVKVGKNTNVTEAMADGRAVAIQIDAELRGREVRAEYVVEREILPGDPKYRVYPANRLRRNFPGMGEISDRSGFDVVEQGFDDDGALLETYRCLQCGYREVDTSKCIGCTVCSKVCPKGDAITMIAVPEE